MLATSSVYVLPVVHQHAEESAVLRNVRSVLLDAPHVNLFQLSRLDNRLEAHLDGLAVAGEFGWSLCEAALENPGTGEVFVATVRAVEDRNLLGLEKLVALVEALPDSQPGYISAFGWVSTQFLQGTIRSFLVSSSPFQRQVGIAACAMHQVDAGAALVAAIDDADVFLRRRGLRVAGTSGRRDLLGACQKALADEDVGCRYWAASSAVLLGERAESIDVLRDIALHDGPFRVSALRLVLKLLDTSQSRLLLKTFASDPANIRLLIKGAGVAGDPHYVPWLIKQMEDPKLARLAVESLSFITGLDLAKLDLSQHQPEGFESGPNDNPDDADVAMDPDDNLPWPDPLKIKGWWDANMSRFSVGVRHFMGEPANPQNCKRVLREGYQRQRIAAAEYLCLLQPGTSLFPTSAPAWRQLRWLNKMG